MSDTTITGLPAAAGVVPRLLAMGADLVVITLWAALAAVAGLGARAAGVDFGSPITADAFAFVVLVAPVVVTFAWQEASVRQATWGKRRLGLHVTDRAGRRTSLGRSLARSAVKFGPWQVAHTAVFGLVAGSTSLALMVLAVASQAIVLGSLVGLAADHRHRALHDLIAGTVVVGTRDGAVGGAQSDGPAGLGR
jgi:uncharacterized RDD family membrane protein YckC